MKNLDFFRQPRHGNVKSTVYGGAISLFSLTLLVMLIVYQIASFEETSNETQVTVENNKMAESMATIELNLTIFDVPCLLINPMSTSEVDSSIESIEETFEKTRIYEKDGKVIYEPEGDFVALIEASNDEEEVKKILKEGLYKGESCNLYANLYVPKILGSLSFVTMVNPAVLQIAKNEGFNIEMKTHEFHSLRFKNGVKNLLDDDDPFFMEDSSDAIELFDRIKDIDHSIYKTGNEASHVVYFATAVPHVIYDPYTQEDLYTYSYSLNHNKRDDQDVPGVSLFYDFSPLTMRVTKRVNSTGKLAINICATICGVFVMFGMLNRILHNIMGFNMKED